MVVLDGFDLDEEYIVRVATYNGTGPNGGDSLTEDLNIWYEVSLADPVEELRCSLPSVEEDQCADIRLY